MDRTGPPTRSSRAELGALITRNDSLKLAYSYYDKDPCHVPAMLSKSWIGICVHFAPIMNGVLASNSVRTNVDTPRELRLIAAMVCLRFLAFSAGLAACAVEHGGSARVGSEW